MNPLWPALLAMLSAGLAIRGVVLARDRGPIARLSETEADRATPLMPRIVEGLSRRLGPRLWRAIGEARRERIHRRLDLAGRPGGLSVEGFVGRQAAYAALGALFGIVFSLVTRAWVLIPPLAVVAAYAPHIRLSRLGRQRQERLERDLPDFLDVLSITVRAGLGYRQALARVSESLGGPVGEEITTALRQMAVGASRRDALIALRERNDAEALNSFVAAQLQAEELGVPLADALADIAADVRRAARQAARQRAQRAAPRVSLVVTTLFVPASGILLLVSLFLSSGLKDAGVF